MDTNWFSRENRLRCESPEGFNHPLDAWSTSDWVTALVGEIGEAANIVKKLNRIRDGMPNRKGEAKEQLLEELASELADAYCYFDLLAQSLNIDLPEAIIKKFNQVSEEIGYRKVI